MARVGGAAGLAVASGLGAVALLIPCAGVVGGEGASGPAGAKGSREDGLRVGARIARRLATILVYACLEEAQVAEGRKDSAESI